MYTYVTTKIVNAKPMTNKQFDLYKTGVKNRLDVKEVPGYFVRYPDGYESWCPKDEFERTSRPVTAAEADSINFDPETV